MLREMDDEEIENLLDGYYSRDMHYEEGRILGSMYTKPPDVVLKSFFKFYQANLGNAGLYPGTAELEREVVKFLLKLTSGSEDFYGRIVSGGTEANITALWAAREMGYSRILTTEDAHFSVTKAAKLLKIPLKRLEVKNGIMDIDALSSELRRGDIVVLTAGTTPLGLIDPIEEVSKLCDEGCYLHVDAAFGGYVIPFLRELGHTDKKFGFDVENVMSVTIDPHKMGMAPYPAGGLVARENLFERIAVDAPYLMGGKSDTLLGTRQSGSVAAAYAAILHFRWEGYRKVVKECMDRAEYMVKRAEEEGFDVPFKPEMNIVNIGLKDVRKAKEILLTRGWGISTNPKYSTVRIVVMPHVTREVIERFLEELKNIKRDYGL
ncbi:tyrosine decarboxylase MnfA [Aciduliprofundum sp. MAR08-339]|nr:tyrosine decarboxylase MnfA [Aciduliprofundum sp. MAR08-339]